MKEVINSLITFEYDHVNYQSPNPGDKCAFEILSGTRPVILSAPHGSRCFRPGEPEHYHSEDEYTAAIVRFLHERTDASAIYMVRRSATDPNFDLTCPYKDALEELIVKSQATFVLDIHGVSASRAFAIDLGCRGHGPLQITSCPLRAINTFKSIWRSYFDSDHEVTINRFPSLGKGTIASFIVKRFRGAIPVIQIEINARYRIPQRKPDSTSHGLFPLASQRAAQYSRIISTLNVLERFIIALAPR